MISRAIFCIFQGWKINCSSLQIHVEACHFGWGLHERQRKEYVDPKRKQVSLVSLSDMFCKVDIKRGACWIHCFWCDGTLSHFNAGNAWAHWEPKDFLGVKKKSFCDLLLSETHWENNYAMKWEWFLWNPILKPAVELANRYDHDNSRMRYKYSMELFVFC